MAKFKSKAEIAFEIKSSQALAKRDWVFLETVYHQFGCYLQLVDMRQDLTEREVNSFSRAVGNLEYGVKNQ